jgi:hypothetical protein
MTRFRAARLVLGAAGWTAIALAIVEAIGRQLTRRHPFPFLPESPGHLLLIPLAGLVVLLLVGRRGFSLGLKTQGSTEGQASADSQDSSDRHGPIDGQGAGTGQGFTTSKRTTAAVFAGLFAIGLVAQLQFGARLQSDGFYYFACLRSMAFDHDADFTNDYRMLGLGDKAHLFVPTPTGYAQSAWAIGPALVWSPFFAAGHVAARWLDATGRTDVAPDGTSFPYRQAVVIAGLFYALLGSWFALRFARVFTDGRIAAAAVALVMCGSFMLWYALVEPTMTHAPSMAAVAGFAWFWAATMGRRRLWQWTLLGAVAGFIGLVRWQNVLFALLPACDALVLLWHTGRARDWRGARSTLLAGVAFTIAAVIAFTPQLIQWKAIYGHYFAVSPIGPAMRFTAPHVIETLFSSRNGLFAMSPVMYVAAIGMVAFAWRRPAAGVPLVLAVAAMTYFNASVQDWWGSAGYGGRRFDGVAALVVPGMAASIAGLRALTMRRPQIIVGAAAVLAVAWNVTYLAAVNRGVASPVRATDFGEVSAYQAETIVNDIGHPFEYPVSLWFALSNGVRPSAYDYLGGGFLGDPKQPYGRINFDETDARLIGDGWSAVMHDGPHTFREATSRARVIVPLHVAAALDVQIHLRAVPSVPAGALTLVLDTGRARFGPVAVPSDWQTVRMATPKSAWRAGVNRVDLLFADAGPNGPDGRVADIDYLRIQVREEPAP